MTRRDLLLAGGVLLLALALRLHDLGHPPTRWLDEAGHIPAATHYWEAGQFEPDFWEHPPLRHLLAQAGLWALGDNPYGWRLRNVLFGAAAAGLTFLLALHATGSRRAALLAGALLATDPLHVVTSRFTFEEIYGGALFLASVVAFLHHRERCGRLVLSALLMGCALATKWYYVPGWLLLAGASLWQARRGRAPALAFAAACWLLAPLAVYVAAYYPWFGRGYGLGELWGFTADAYRSLQSLTARDFSIMDTRTVFQGHRSAAAWFVAPILSGEGTLLGPDRGEFILYLNDPPIWWLTLPAVLAMAVAAARARRLAPAWPALLFAASYALFLVVRRPAFVYSALPLLPFAFAAIAAGVDRLCARLAPRAFWPVAALLVAWGLYLWPLATAKQVPLAPYRAVLERIELRLH